jgi:hypothetical protein
MKMGEKHFDQEINKIFVQTWNNFTELSLEMKFKFFSMTETKEQSI